MAQLVLWDIDHTLVDTRGVGRSLWAEAFRQVTGQEMKEQAKIDGLTEQVIFRETAKLYGLTTNRTDFDAFAQALGERHVRRAAELRERGHALDGAASALDALAARGLQQTVVTGNVRAAAEVKVATFGLDHHLDLPVGAYGEDAEERAELVTIALKRAGHQVGETVLVGDTPADVAAGLSAGVRVVGVATGRSSADALHEAGAHSVLADLSDTQGVLKTLIVGV
ncbi:phosphoglycolate phosphatase [Streptomyces sp. WAC 06783]|uniref:HAD family hydrolase n=1 Tax=Streptomyces sp. WAC 06783 TaxID=2203211 RepID=UPI000F741439|nr:HAD hydrolase-like protein [Streptomyces sp. WAC 06783]RSO09309.1 phosphoglycolate phosphatase [Streptomyces sp. WAC 06783]